jgi:hypothetical protein
VLYHLSHSPSFEVLGTEFRAWCLSWASSIPLEPHPALGTLFIKAKSYKHPECSLKGDLLNNIFCSIEYRALVAHACDPSYSGGRDQEDCSPKPAQANSSRDLILKKPIAKKGLVEWHKVYRS